MQLQEMQHYLPRDWVPMDLENECYKKVSVQPWSHEYNDILSKIRGRGRYYKSIGGIYKIQNPHLYTKYAKKLAEYQQRGPCKVLSLFHDTATRNVDSISTYNFDRRFGSRFKYGPGVYFSILPDLANRHSSRKNSSLRSMFIADVIVQNVQEVDGDIYLPDFGYDTVLAHNAQTYVKYYDCEYYPRYVVDYVSVK